MRLFNLDRVMVVLTLVLVVGFSVNLRSEQPPVATPTKPNFVVFVADDMGWGDSATYGNKLIQTPNLDRLASQGVKFTQCYSACGVCSPSRSAILTGRTPYRNGVWRHLSGNHEAHLRASEITYPKATERNRLRNLPRWKMASQFATTVQ